MESSLDKGGSLVDDLNTRCILFVQVMKLWKVEEFPSWLVILHSIVLKEFDICCREFYMRSILTTLFEL